MTKETTLRSKDIPVLKGELIAIQNQISSQGISLKADIDSVRLEVKALEKRWILALMR